MPSYLMTASYSPGGSQQDGWTRYYVPAGDVRTTLTTEAWAQALARDSYTLSDLFVRVKTNALTGATTIKSRIGGADGNQVISIGAAATGAFTDAVNTDSLVSGNLFCTQAVTAAGGTEIIFTIFSYILSTASNTTPILAASGGYYQWPYANQYPTIGGDARDVNGYPTEASAYYKFRVSAILSNLRVYVGQNSASSTTTIKSRINAANGNQALSVGATATGSFEDAVNTDSIVIGNNVNLHLNYPSSGNSFQISIFQLKSTSAGKQVLLNAPFPGREIADGLTRYLAIEGRLEEATSEGNTQLTARAVFTAKNMYVNVYDNDLNGATTLRMRKNGGDGNLLVSMPAATAGQFEDLVNSDSFIATDSLNWKLITGGSVNDIDLLIIGFELSPPAPPAPELENKSANMGSKMVGAGLI